MRATPTLKLSEPILSGVMERLRESGHSNESGYIQFCNLCDEGHYLERQMANERDDACWRVSLRETPRQSARAGRVGTVYSAA
ncbi:hypothetical protein EFS38_01175 [Dickeya undicola]|uniref:Uncharacterized protein n=1 Tax=Dickeya undicola TaxID=1577887 RepID=A0A3N0G1R8_9GAMM|nr:hypothetical protein EF878_10130 [Dickeya undicola]RNM28673.1 hypothetical protein EFS38_01175 [Dickeya undicola]